MNHIEQEKQALRRQFRQERSKINVKERSLSTQKINRQLKKYIKKNKKIGIYWPIGKELKLDDFIQTALKRGAKLYLPYIEPNKRRLWFTPYFANIKKQQPECQRHHSKIYIPQFYGKKIRVHQLNILFVPIVGIDKRGYRLGQAGGFYDASLAQMKHRLQARAIGVGFGCQLCDVLPHEAHDIRLHGFVSENGILNFNSTD